MKVAIVFLFALLVVTPVSADPPIDGTYQSTDLGGLMLIGRYTESWSMANGELQLGNTTNKLSWDGATLGTQWWMYCADISVPPLLLLDTVDVNGNGQRQYLVTYQGGICILDGNGPWGNGSEPSYTALYDTYSEIKLFQFSNFQIVGMTASASMQASFIGFSNACMSLSISNQERYDDTDNIAKPPNFPDFLAPSTCAPTRTMGSWGEADEFTLIVTGCTVASEESTWGAIKALYGE
jgi:hypothetical protein